MAAFGERVRKIREALGMTQERLAEILGISRPSVSQIENGKRRLSAEELLKMAKALGASADEILDLKRRPEVILSGKKRVERPRSGMRLSIPQKNLRKFQEVILYVLSKVGSKPNVGEAVIYKLLYFIDFDFYEKYEEQLMGATYIRNHYGPTPVEFQKVVDDMVGREELVKVRSKYFQYPQTKYLPRRKPDLSQLGANEKEVIDTVLSRLSDMNAAQIRDYSHNDIPWATAEDGEKIDYEAVFYRTPQYSVRVYDEGIQQDRETS
jgi:transcriptional regulator with XRE-family HTH domain